MARPRTRDKPRTRITLNLEPDDVALADAAAKAIGVPRLEWMTRAVTDAARSTVAMLTNSGPALMPTDLGEVFGPIKLSGRPIRVPADFAGYCVTPIPDPE